MQTDGNEGKRFNLWELLQKLIKAASWQLRLRGCLEPSECGHDLTNGWVFGGRPTKGGYFLVLDDETLVAFIPNAIDEEKVMHKLVALRARGWKRDCARCRFNTCAILDDFEDPTEGRQSGIVLVDPKDPRELLHSLRLAEEILAHIKNEQTREFFVDYYVFGLPIDQIAAQAGLKPNSVRRRILREVHKLQAIFIPAPLGDKA